MGKDRLPLEFDDCKVQSFLCKWIRKWFVRGDRLRIFSWPDSKCVVIHANSVRVYHQIMVRHVTFSLVTRVSIGCAASGTQDNSRLNY